MIERSMRPILRLMAILAIAGTFGTFGAPSAIAATSTTASNTSTKAVIVPVPSSSTSGRVAAQVGTGFIKICKTLEAGSPDNGAGLFTFTTTGPGANVTVRIDAPATPGQKSCTRFAVPAGVRLTVTEAFNNRYIVAPNGITFQADPGTPRATTNVFTQQAFLTPAAGQTTEVTFVNRFVNSTLKICKEYHGSTFAPGRLFRFTVRGSVVYPDVIVRESSCAQTRVRAGTVVVQEVVPADFQVTAIAIRAGTGTVDVPNARATLNQEVDRVSEVVFQNRGFGFIQVCKETTGALRSGTFTFTSPSAGFGGSQTINVAPGATQPVCGPLTRLAAGFHAITEAASGNTILNGVRTEPTNRNLTVSGRTATFRLPVGTASQQTLVIFDNALRGYIQICKETVGGFPGQFRFTGNFPRAGIYNQTINVTAGATQPVCGPLTPVNAGVIQATELATAGTTLVGVRTIGPGTILSRAGNTVNVNVPATGPGNQTLIIFRNAQQ